MIRSMARTALTFWFTITTLLGPGICCCSFGFSLTSDRLGAAGTQSATAKPVKSCCQQGALPCGDSTNHKPSKPSKCPCKHGTQVTTLPPSATANANIVAQLKLLDLLFVGFLAPFAFDSVAIPSTPLRTFQPVFRLAGRDLLAAYSVLRC